MKFIDLCSGIGGGRLGLENNAMSCIAHAEIDPIPEKTYQLFFGEEQNLGDLMHINTSNLPNFDLLIGGFPCQTFSIVGKRAGFQDERGTVIYGIAKILRECNVKYFVLENVKGLLSHNKGATFKSIRNLLETSGYDLFHKVICSVDCGIPQIRERVYFIGIRKGLMKRKFKFPDPVMPKSISEFLIDDNSVVFDINNDTFQRYLNNKYNKGNVDLAYILEHDYWLIDTRQSDLRIQKQFCPTLRTGRHGILYVKNRQLRVLSGKEALLLQGFPLELANKAADSIADSRIKAQAGNAMTVNVITNIAKEIIKSI